MQIEFIKKQRGITEQAVDALERKLGITFPDDYRYFLIVYNGGKPLKNLFQWKGKSGKPTGSLIDWFLTAQDKSKSGIELYFHRYEGRMPNNLVPVAHDPGGNIVCMSCAGEDRGAIYFWDHEQEALVIGKEQPYWGNLRLVAGSFTQLLEMLTEYRI